MLACDFFTVETLGLQRIYVLFFISLATRRLEFIACTRGVRKFDLAANDTFPRAQTSPCAHARGG